MKVLPASRNTTYTPATPVKSADLNDIQDCIVNSKRNARWRYITPTTPNLLNFAGAQTMAAQYIQFGNAGMISGLLMPHLEEGERITDFGIRFLGTGGVITMKFDLMLNTGGVTTSLGQLQIVTPPAAWATYTFTLAAEHVVAAGEALYLDSIAQGALVAMRLGPVGLKTYRS